MIVDFLQAPSLLRWWRALRPGARRAILIGVAAVLVAGIPVCLLAGASPALPPVALFLLVVAVRPFPGLIYLAAVFCMPLGLWMTGVQALFGHAFGGRDYALSLSSAVVACSLLAVTLLRRPPRGRALLAGAVVIVVLGVWSLIGFADHGITQTLVGDRLTTLPLILFVLVGALTVREITLLVSVLAGMVIANAVAAVVEYIIGPAELVALGFEPERGVRLIGDTFRAPGLTEVNAELGLLAGGFLLGYAALWLVRDLRPRRRLWHVAAGAAAVALALSTNRTGALLLAGGLLSAVVLNRGGGAAMRKRARFIGFGTMVAVALGFVAIGATGSSSTFERFQVWGNLLASGAPWYGLGVGGVGAATGSRVSSSATLVFVDNYFVSISLQLGIPILIAVVALVGWALFRLSRGSERRPYLAVHLALLAGLALASLMVETWEYAAAMMCLVVFWAYTAKTATAADEAEVAAVVTPVIPRPRQDQDQPAQQAESGR
ncbi:hypothetical protein [Actinoplanes palleronii]|uniref:O-antigen ligase n=1 Tax=Actinoplanes palleronii TaxID=113570 RepID=A0ABQ4B280_9ACTN|nr:hypothetical protein [Actinoplanes palleronii]GIE64779.1 hypothetical protein Apa02nite_008870 [Actinoplanes palleronii]